MPIAGTVAGVQALVEPVIEAGSKPSVAEVEDWLAEYAAAVGARLASYDDLDDPWPATVELNARRLVHLAVAATVVDASYPERATRTDEDYGSVLWARYTEGLEDLAAQVEELLTGEEGPGTTTAEAVASFPAPLFRQSTEL